MINLQIFFMSLYVCSISMVQTKHSRTHSKWGEFTKANQRQWDELAVGAIWPVTKIRTADPITDHKYYQLNVFEQKWFNII